MPEVIATTQLYDALLKEDYVQDEIESAINKETVFKKKLTRKQTTHGRRALYAVQLATAQGNGSRGELEPLPQSDAATYQDAIVNTFNHYATFKVSGQAEVYSSANAFAEAVETQVKDTAEGLTLNVARQSWGDGSGTINLLNGALTSGAIVATVDSAYGVLWGSLATNTTYLLKYGMKVQFGTENNGGQGYTIGAITGTTFAFSPALQNNVADNARITLNNSANKEMEGWLKMVATASFMTSDLGMSTAVYHNIDRAVQQNWEGNVTDAGAALSLTNIRGIKDKLFKRGGTADLCIVSTEVCRDYEALLTPNQRFVPAIKLEGGATAIEHDGLAFTKDKDAPVKALSLVNTSEIAWLQRNSPGWIMQGDQIMRVISGYDAKEAVMRWYANLDTKKPRTQALLYDITVAA